MTSSSSDIADAWRQTFMERLKEHAVAQPLREAALRGRLGAWTTLVTEQVVRSCEALGWRAAAKGFPLDLLPKTGHEYLNLDAMAFCVDQTEPSSAARWHFPIAVFELENSSDDQRVAYSLWKVLCVRTKLRAVFAYRKTWEPAVQLVSWLADEVVGRIPAHERTDLTGKTFVVVGSRSEGELFPWGYFKLWSLNTNTARFERI